MLCTIGALVASREVAALTPDNTSDNPSTHSLVAFALAAPVFVSSFLVCAKACALQSCLQTWFATKSLGFASAFMFVLSV